ncbi:hypothetical protein X801_07886 [Opisthorchis viverrini]|uniref:Large ribosomal subunit protein uL14m n=1 Tax=Opisthorchis viverrini TaxID=6198 RepID=A0A1S8WPZ7_OPIVI|nr:hypothetical protein X801_07886 [Opisthorchis viverrini]
MLMSLNKSLSSKPALCIRVYTHNNKGKIGDKVLVAVGGQKKKGWIVGTRQQSRDGWPRFESNNIVLVDDEGNPLGTRILVPVPAKLRTYYDQNESLKNKSDMEKMLSQFQAKFFVTMKVNYNEIDQNTLSELVTTGVW